MKPGHRPSNGWWVIVDGTTATAFRARQRETLLPTLTQLRRTQPGVSLRWIERGRVFESPDHARATFMAERLAKRPPARPADWRPGGSHRDPRARYELSRDQKRARFKARQRFGGPGGPAGPDRAAGPPRPGGPTRHGGPGRPPAGARRPGRPPGRSRWGRPPGKKPR